MSETGFLLRVVGNNHQAPALCQTVSKDLEMNELFRILTTALEDILLFISLLK